MKMSKCQTIRLHRDDNCIVVGATIESGSLLVDGENQFELKQDVALGHKVASVLILKGSQVLKYGASIGVATANIQPGEHVHLHNMRSNYLPTHTLNKTEVISHG